jgi:hypothetical protein
VLGVGGGGKGFRYRTFSFYSNKIAQVLEKGETGIFPRITDVFIGYKFQLQGN